MPSRSAKIILGEADSPKPPAHWGHLPGYGELADPKRLLPYTEDLGIASPASLHPRSSRPGITMVSR